MVYIMCSIYLGILQPKSLNLARYNVSTIRVRKCASHKGYTVGSDESGAYSSQKGLAALHGQCYASLVLECLPCPYTVKAMDGTPLQKRARKGRATGPRGGTHRDCGSNILTPRYHRYRVTHAGSYSCT